jgi:hypothetical protein
MSWLDIFIHACEIIGLIVLSHRTHMLLFMCQTLNKRVERNTKCINNLFFGPVKGKQNETNI